MPPAERGGVPGIKPERGDLILAGALVIQTVMEVGGFDALEVTEAGLREGAFFEALLDDHDPPLFDDVRHASVINLAAAVPRRTSRTPSTSRAWRWSCGTRSAEQASTAATEERELLWAAAMLHDIGTAVDYDDHHKHSRYLILNAGLPGFTPRETALIGQMARYHRKGNPGAGRVRPARARRRRGAAGPLRGGAAGRRAARAPARPDRRTRRRRA